MAKARDSTDDRRSHDGRRLADVFAKPLAYLALSARSAKCLRNDNITTLGLLVTCTAAELLRAPNFGRKSLAEVQTVLATLGLCLDGDPVPSRRQQARARLLIIYAPSEPNPRNRAICKARRSGQTLQQVGATYGVSRERVRQLMIREERERKRKQAHRRFVALVARINGRDLTAQVKALRARRDELRRERDAARAERARQEHAAMVAARTAAEVAWHARIAAEHAEQQAQIAAQLELERSPEWQAEQRALAAERLERQRLLDEQWPCPGCGLLSTTGADMDAGWRVFPVWIICSRCGHLQVVAADLARHDPNDEERAQALAHAGVRKFLGEIHVRRYREALASGEWMASSGGVDAKQVT